MSSTYKKIASLTKVQKEKLAKSVLIMDKINGINMITNESLEDLDVVGTYEMKNLKEINFEIVMLERTKNNLEEFEINNILEKKLKERIKILKEKRNEVRKIF